MVFIFDTNILIEYLRGNETTAQLLEQNDCFLPSNTAAISIVVQAELYAFAIKNKWGEKRINFLESLISQLLIIPIDSKAIVEKYAEIDAFSQGSLSERTLGRSAVNMGKNDLWIAATTALINGSLVTTDNDFKHLENIYFPILTKD
jgi:tRNA(fMet)-specific endonuclease VapC